MAHTHSHAAPEGGRTLGLSIAPDAGLRPGRGGRRLLAHSLALLSDAGHNFADALALVFSWYALRVARRPADARRTFGYHRVGILAALVNAVSLVVIALLHLLGGGRSGCVAAGRSRPGR